MVTEFSLWWLDFCWEGLRRRKLVTDRWVHVYPGIVSSGRSEGGYGIAICVQLGRAETWWPRTCHKSRMGYLPWLISCWLLRINSGARGEYLISQLMHGCLTIGHTCFPCLPRHKPPFAFPNLLHCCPLTSPTLPCHYPSTFSTFTAYYPHLPFSLLSHLSQFNTFSDTNRSLQDNVLPLGRQGKHVRLIIRQLTMQTGLCSGI